MTHPSPRGIHPALDFPRDPLVALGIPPNSPVYQFTIEDTEAYIKHKPLQGCQWVILGIPIPYSTERPPYPVFNTLLEGDTPGWTMRVCVLRVFNPDYPMYGALLWNAVHEERISICGLSRALKQDEVNR